MAPAVFTAAIDQAYVNNANQGAISFTFGGAEAGTDYDYTISSSGGGTSVTGSGTIATATDAISGLNLAGLNDGTLTLSVTLSDTAGNTRNATSTKTKDAAVPAGYLATFDQAYVNNYNKTAISFTFTGAEPGTSYAYTITDSLSGSINGSGTVSTATDTISPINVDSLADTPLTLTVTLADAAGNVGTNATDLIVKDETPPDNTGFPGNVSTGASQSVTIGSSGDTTNTVWFAPLGTTTFVEGSDMTKASGIATSILSPADGGSYYLYVVDQFGNISSPSVGILTVDAIAPSNQNLVYPSSSTVGVSKPVSINASSAFPGNGGSSSDTVWLATAGTTTFAAGPTMTSANGDATTITSPAAGGTYYVYVLDSVGNASPASTATLTVDATAPTNQDDVFDTPATVGSAKPVTIAASSATGGESTDTVWLAPAGTTSFVANGTTITTAGGDATSITSPSTGGTYRLYVIDQYGNISQASDAILTVDATAPTNQNLVFPSNVTDISGANITINASSATGGDSTDTVWFAPSGTTTFVYTDGATITTASGSSTTLTAPTTEGDYKLFVLDQYGNVSSASSKTLTVDNSSIEAIILGAPSDPSNVTTLSITISGSIDNYQYKIGDGTIDCSNLSGYSGDLTKSTPITDDISPTGLNLSDGTIKLCVRGERGGFYQSTPSSTTWTKDTQAPTNQDSVFGAGSTVKGGTSITISASSATGGDSTDSVWFAPNGTTTFSEGTNMTRAGGDATSISAPSDNGTNYRIYVIDAAGNVSNPSSAVLVVDNIAPTDQNTVFSANQWKQGGATVTLDATTTEAEVWFAPNGTTTFTKPANGSTMTMAAGSAGSIAAPTTAGAYRLYVIDTAGNISNASVAVLTVDNTAPTISGVSPASSSSVTNSNVSYTLSETCASGSITWDWVSGTADTDHTYTLTDTELNSGAHSITATATLQTGATYNVVFSGTDAAGNNGTTTSTGVVYGSGDVPTIYSATTMDADNDGKIDHYKIVFRDALLATPVPIDDSTFPGGSSSHNIVGASQTDWTIAGYSNVVIVTGTQAPEADTQDDATIYLRFTEGAGYDTGAKPDLTTSATPGLKSTSNVAMVRIFTPDVTEADGAKPIVVGASGTTTFTALTVAFSEAVYGTTANTPCTSGSSGLMGTGTLTYTDGNASAGATGISGMGSDVCASDAGFNATYTTNAAFVTGDTADSVHAATVYDAADNTGNALAVTNLNIVAATVPLVSRIETFDSNNNGKVEQLKITFNRNMDDSTIDTADAAQFTVNTVTADDVDSVTGGTSTISAPNDDPGSVNDTVVTVFTDDTTVTGTGSLAIAFNYAAGRWRASGGAELQSVSDLSAFLVDRAPPVLMSAVAYENTVVGLTDIDSDDTMVLTFSEPTNKVVFNTASVSTGVNLDTVLQLSGGHTWGSRDAITSAVWNGAGDQLTLTFSDGGTTPATVATGDTILIIGTSLKDTAPIPNTSTNIAGREAISGSFVTDLYPPYMLSVYNIRARSITVQFSEPMLCDGSANAIDNTANYTVTRNPYGTPVDLTGNLTSIDVVSSSAVQLNFNADLQNLVMHNVAIKSGRTVVDQASPTANQIVYPDNLDFIVNEQLKVVNASPVTQYSVRLYFNKIPKAGNNVAGSAGCSGATECNRRYKISPTLGDITSAIVGTGVLANTVTITHTTAQTGKAYTVIAANNVDGDGFNNTSWGSIRNVDDSENVQLIPKDRAGFTGLGPVIDDLGDGDFFADPFVDGTAFSYTFTYGNRVYLGTNDTNKIAFRFDPAGTNAVTATFDFSQAGGSYSCLTADGFGYNSGATCGVDMGYYGEFGVGGFTSGNLTISSTNYEMLLVGPLKTGIKQAYFTQDLDTILNWKQFTIFSTTGANAEAIHTMYAVDNRLYVALSTDHQNFAPQVGVHTITESSGVLSIGTAADMNIYNLGTLGKKATNPATSGAIVGIDSFVKYNGYLYMANNGGVYYSDNAGTPVLDSNFYTYADSATPSGWTGRTLVLNTLSKINPGSKGVPIMRAYNGKLYVIRNVASGTTSTLEKTHLRGEFWVCNPATSGNTQACDPGDWTQLISGSETGTGPNYYDGLGPGSNAFSMFEINGEYAYLGVDNATSGGRVFRMKVTNPSSVPIDIPATNGSTMTSAGWGAFVVLDADYPDILSSTTISDGTSDFIYITTGEFGSTTKPIKVYRQKD